MKDTKYIHSGGLAFSEEKDMKRLSHYAKKGWILEGFAPFGYRLKKGKPQNLIYNLDYQKEADEEYFSFFKAGNWTYVCSAGNEIHVFSAPEGTEPIYSDRATYIDKYEREMRQMGKYALPLLIVTVIFFLLSLIDFSPIAGKICLVLGTVTLIALVFPGLPYLSYKFKLYRLSKQ